MLNSYKPLLADLWFKQQMLSDPDTMSYNHAYGGTIEFPSEKWKSWYERWLNAAASQRYYRYLQNEDGDFVGEMSYHYDSELNGFLADVLIYAPCRHKGYGSAALDMLCACAKANGINSLYDSIAIDNPSVNLFISHGFSEVYRTDEIVLVKKTL